MRNILGHLQTLSLVFLGFSTLLILGAEPNTTESSMYEYEHFCDVGHFGWYLCWGWVVSLVTLIITIIIQIKNKNK
jgi:hypothetical protein